MQLLLPGQYRMQLQHRPSLARHQLGTAHFHIRTSCKRPRSHRRHCCCQAKASAKPGENSKPSFAQSKRKPSGAFSKTQQSRLKKFKGAHQQEAADLALLRQQKATSASKKVLKVNGLQRAAALRGLSPTAQPFSVAHSAFQVS